MDTMRSKPPKAFSVPAALVAASSDGQRGLRLGAAATLLLLLGVALFPSVPGTAAPAAQSVKPCGDHYIYLSSSIKPGPENAYLLVTRSTPRPPCGTPTAPTGETPTTPTPTRPAPSTTPPPGTSPTPTLPPTQRPTDEPRPTATVPKPAGEGRLGVQIFEGDLELIQAGHVNEAGAGWARMRALWGAVERDLLEQPLYQWGMSDSVLFQLVLADVRPIMAIYEWPDWASDIEGNCGPLNAEGRAHYRDFLSALVERYDGDGVDDGLPFGPHPGVKHWEIGNEPDFMLSAANGENDYGSCFGDDPVAYAELLADSYEAIKAADPEAVVLFGGVAYDRFADAPDDSGFTPTGPFRYDFVRAVLRALHDTRGSDPAFPFFDWIGFHNYNDFKTNWTTWGPEIVGKAEHLRQQQLVVDGAFDLRDLPMISTEIGLPAMPSDDFTLRSEGYQAAYIGQAAARAAQAGLRAAVWYTLTDYTLENCDNPYDWLLWGLLRSKLVDTKAALCPVDPIPDYEVQARFERKPVWSAFRTAAVNTGEADFVSQVPDTTTRDPSIVALRLRQPDGTRVLVAYTEHGERLGRRASSDLTVEVRIDPDWLVETPAITVISNVRVFNHIGELQPADSLPIEAMLDARPMYVVYDVDN